MKVGITGHQSRIGIDWDWVETEIAEHLAALPSPTTGLSSLATGADQVFARAILEIGGVLEAVLPFPGYSSTFDTIADREKFEELLRSASVVNLPGGATEEESYLQAGQRIVDLSDVLFAVWDGKPASGLGGTADIVAYALRTKKPVVHLNVATKTAMTLGRE